MFSLKLFIRGKKVQFQYTKGVISLPPACRCGTSPLPAISPIQSSFIYCQLRLIPHQGHGGAGSSLHHQTPATFAHNWEQLSISDQADLHVFGLWEETTAPGENPHSNIKPKPLTTTMLFTGIYLYHLYLKWARLKEKQKQTNISRMTLCCHGGKHQLIDILIVGPLERKVMKTVGQTEKWYLALSRMSSTLLSISCFMSLVQEDWILSPSTSHLRWSQHASNRLSSPLYLIYAHKHCVRSEIHILQTLKRGRRDYHPCITDMKRSNIQDLSR